MKVEGETDYLLLQTLQENTLLQNRLTSMSGKQFEFENLIDIN